MSHKKDFFSRSASNFNCSVGFAMKGAPSKDLFREDFTICLLAGFFLFLMRSATIRIIKVETPKTIDKPKSIVTTSRPDGASEDTSGSILPLSSSEVSSSSSVSGSSSGVIICSTS